MVCVTQCLCAHAQRLHTAYNCYSCCSTQLELLRYPYLHTWHVHVGQVLYIIKYARAVRIMARATAS